MATYVTPTKRAAHAFLGGETRADGVRRRRVRAEAGAKGATAGGTSKARRKWRLY
jgi:hypothetical protein